MESKSQTKNFNVDFSSVFIVVKSQSPELACTKWFPNPARVVLDNLISRANQDYTLHVKHHKMSFIFVVFRYGSIVALLWTV